MSRTPSSTIADDTIYSADVGFSREVNHARLVDGPGGI
jgi:hypothetical protein